jgi:hypothetical protein
VVVTVLIFAGGVLTGLAGGYLALAYYFAKDRW